MSVADDVALFRSVAVDFVSEEELKAKLARGKPLRVKMGFDPSSPNLHLGHVVGLDFLARLQERGHRIIFLVGDFTARIGDPTGRSRTRPALSSEQVEANSRTYAEQVSSVLDVERAELRFNNEWIQRLTPSDVLRLMAEITVARMLEREDFAKRYAEGASISLHEFMYPLLQAYDSVALAADVEVGGTDQLFNMLLGRQLQKSHGQEPQVVVTLPLLVGTDGVEKMSKSLDNAIGIREPAEDIYGKTMSIADELLPTWIGLLAPRLRPLAQGLEAGTAHPRDVKAALAEHLAARFHGADGGRQAAEHFDRVFRRKETPEEMFEVQLQAGASVAQALAACGFAASRGESRRLVAQGGVKLAGERVTDADSSIGAGEYVLQVGKRRFARLRVLG